MPRLIPLSVDWEDIVQVTGYPCTPEEVERSRSLRTNWGALRFCTETHLVVCEDIETPPSTRGGWHIFPRGCVRELRRLDGRERKITWEQCQKLAEGL